VTRFVLIFALAVALCTGCGGPGAKPEADLTSEGLKEDAGYSEMWLPESEPYRLTVGDALTIKFFYYPLYDFTALVRPDGMVTVPLMGDVKAAGLKPSELEQVIRAHYTEVVAEPEVAVMVTNFGNQRVFVFGEVADPGAYPLAGRMSVIDAVVVAGGIRPEADGNGVVLMRRSAEGSYVARLVDLDAKISGRDTEVVYLAPADIVYVPLSAIGKLDRFVDQFFNKLTPAWRFYILGREVVGPEGETIISQ
jgi:polysaccharide export outer membrane protein